MLKREGKLVAVVTLCAVLLAAVLIVGLRDRQNAAAGAQLTPVGERPAAAVESAAGFPRPSSPEARRALRRLAAESDALLDESLEDRLDALRGAPVVVNVWASWCPSCRAEFPAFAEMGRRYAGKVAFIGLDARDDRREAEAFLRELPVGFPSIFDPDAVQARAIGAGLSWPTTVFFNAGGERTFVRQGGYASRAPLDADIRTYALQD